MPGTSEKRARIEQETSEKRARSERETSEKRARSLGALAQFPAYQQSASLRPSQHIYSLSGPHNSRHRRAAGCTAQVSAKFVANPHARAIPIRRVRRLATARRTSFLRSRIPPASATRTRVTCAAGPAIAAPSGNTVRVTAHEPGRRPARRASSFPRLGGGRRQDSDGADPRHSRRDSETLRPGGGSKPDQEARARVRAGPSTRIADLTGPLSAGPAVRPST